MHFLKKNINGSPFIGIFCAASDSICLVPPVFSKKDEKEFSETLNVKVLRTTLANSSLLGVIGLIFEEKIIVPETVEKQEIRFLKENGLEVKQLKGTSALGNLVAFNKHGGIAGHELSKKNVSEIQEFFGIKIAHKDVAGSSLCGACIEANSNGFIISPKARPDEIESLEKIFGATGVPTTANYGDRFVGNDVVSNNSGAIIGSITTTHEIARIDEAFRT